MKKMINRIHLSTLYYFIGASKILQAENLFTFRRAYTQPKVLPGRLYEFWGEPSVARDAFKEPNRGRLCIDCIRALHGLEPALLMRICACEFISISKQASTVYFKKILVRNTAYYRHNVKLIIGGNSFLPTVDQIVSYSKQIINICKASCNIVILTFFFVITNYNYSGRHW